MVGKPVSLDHDRLLGSLVLAIGLVVVSPQGFCRVEEGKRKQHSGEDSLNGANVAGLSKKQTKADIGEVEKRIRAAILEYQRKKAKDNDRNRRSHPPPTQVGSRKHPSSDQMPSR